MPFITRLPALTGADPYPDALVALDFVGARRGPQYYKALGVTTADITKIPGWTYTGGASTGSYAAKADGSLQLFAQNVPRITDAGYWAEEARTNLLLYSQQFDNAAWSKIATTVTANQAIAPDGTLTADAMAETATTAQHYMLQGVTKAASPATYTASWYVKQFGTARNAKLSIIDNAGAGADYTVNPVTGAVLSGPTYYGGVPFSAASIVVTQVANGFAKIDMTATTNSTAFVTALIQTASGTTLSFLGDTGTGFYIWQADLQAGSFATSPIPTTSVAVTRAADLTPGLSNITSAFDAANGTVFVEFARNTPSGSNARVFSVNETVQINTNITNNAVLQFVANSATSANALTTGAASRVAGAWAGASTIAVALNGSTVATGTYALGSVTGQNLTLGNRASGDRALNAPIRRIVIYPRAFANSELQAITTAGAY